MSKSVADNPRKRFADIVSCEDEQIDLAEAALLIAAEEYAGLDVPLYIEKLDRIGDLAREHAEGARTTSDMIAAINTTLFDELGFCGNRENYYDPRNSFLNEVLDHRTGIPITLTVVYMETARRIGFPVLGVGLPGHFIAKHISDEGDIFIDTFNDGRLLGEAGCAEILKEMSGGRLELKPSHIAAVTNKQILTRMLSNLLGIYADSIDHARSLAAIERILLINPDSPPHVRDRGLLLAALGKTAAALPELKRYLTLAPEARDSSVIREQIKSLQQTLARMN